MECAIKYRAFFAGVILILTTLGVEAQIQSPGQPIGDFRSLEASDAIYLLPPLHPLEVEACMTDRGEDLYKPMQFAIDRPLSISPLSQGVWTRQDGFHIWRAHIISPGAFSLGLVFDEFHLSEDVKVLVYDPGLIQVKGAYTALNNKRSGVLAVGHIGGEELIIEMQVPEKRFNNYGEISLGSLSHAFLPVAVKGTSDKRFGLSGPCEIDINCLEGAGWQLEKHSVVRIQNLYINQYCTGVLLNNTSYDGDPIILTAEHCIQSDEGADKTIFLFNYESSSCFGGDGPEDMSISGSESLAIGDSIDFSLVRLSLTPPGKYDAYYAGWDLGESQQGPTTTIHHPEGDVKKISFDNDAPEATRDKSQIPPYYWDQLPTSFWWIKEWDVGSTEPGSSGSPLFTADRQVIGVLSFGSAKCGDSIGYDAETDRVIYSKTVNRDDYYTKMNVAWDYHPEPARSLKSWLDPTGSGLTSLDGLQPQTLPVRPPVESNTFRLFPNPADEIVWFSALKPRNGFVSYKVFDLQGALLTGGEGSLPGPVRVDVRGLGNGLYLILLESDEGREIHKFVKSQ